MRILYDLLCTQADGATLYTGGAEYGKAVFIALAETIDDGDELTVFYDSERDLDEILLEAISDKNIRVLNIKSREELEKHLIEQSYDLLFSALPVIYRKLKTPDSCLYVGVLHDLRALELAYDSSYKYYLPKLRLRNIKGHIFARSTFLPFLHKLMLNLKIKREANFYGGTAEAIDIIVTVSDHSKYSIQYFLNKEKDIRVYYAPQKNISSLSDSEESKYGNYVLLVSVNRYEKNAINAIKALDRLYSKNMLGTRCVTVGSLPNKIKKKIKHNEKFIHLSYVSREELESLYKHAQLFIFPTLSEGFGMPPLEALKYNTKVVGSAITSVPEICGDSIFYFNPYSVDEIATRIHQAINSENLSNNHFLKTSKRQEEDLKRLVSDIKKGFK